MLPIPYRFMRSSVLLTYLMLHSSGLLAAGEGMEPFATANRHPFVEVFGLPYTQSAYLVAGDSTAVGVTLEAANNFTRDNKGGERIIIDGETHRAALNLKWGISDRFELAASLPYLSHEGGGLDGFIEDWHDWFGFPDGGRPDYPQDQLRYRYLLNGELLADVSRSSDGVGDASVGVGYSLAGTRQRQWTVRGQLKLPTGDADELMGSESTDVSVALHVSDSSWLASSGVVLHASVGVLWMGGGEVLEELREDSVVFGSASLAWQYSENVSFKLQLDGHTAFYDSALTELGDSSAQLVLGGTVRVDPQWELDIAVSEDVAVDTAPDVVFHIALRRRAF